MIQINPDKIAQFGTIHDGTSFRVITTQALKSQISLNKTSRYLDAQIIGIDDLSKVDFILHDDLPSKCHVLIIPYQTYGRIFPKDSSIGKEHKVITLANTTTYCTLDEIIYFLKSLETADMIQQVKLANQIYSGIENSVSNKFKLKNHRFIDDEAIFTLNEMCFFSDFYGPAEYGEQQLAPNGEIAISFKDKVELKNETARLSVSGSIIIQGIPIIHKNGSEPYVTREGIAHLYNKLKNIKDEPVEFVVNNGKIIALNNLIKGKDSALKILTAIFEFDERYTIISEIGLSVNITLKPYPGNCGMNETYAGKFGCIHYGIGSRETLYHMDFICLDAYLTTEEDEILLNNRRHARLENIF